MNRRDLLKHTAVFGLAAGIASLAGICRCAAGEAAGKDGGEDREQPGLKPNPLVLSAKGPIAVAFVISKGAVVIDFCGPWEVFQDVHTDEGSAFFQLYTVAETAGPIRASAGLSIVPDFTFQTAPAPKVIVIPAQDGESPAMLEWIRTAAKSADVTMSVCTGAFLLAKTGLLAGKAATTHHSAYQEFAMEFPDVQLRRGARFVEDGNVASAGGLSSGMDLALRVVERYYGHEKAVQTADMMEYQGRGWLNPDSNRVYAPVRVSTEEHPLCPLCSMDGDRTLTSVHANRAYYFCSREHKEAFDKNPVKYAAR